MGFRYRKSINLGGGFRINISKSGIGYSWGVKGYRITKTARGTVRRTTSIPGSGISFTEETGKNKLNHQQQYTPAIDNNHYDTQNIENTVTNEFVSEGLEDILKSAHISMVLNKLSTILFWLALLLVFLKPIYAISSLVFILMKILVKTLGRVRLDYVIDEDQKEVVENRINEMLKLTECNKVWRLMQSSKVIDKKYSSGASTTVVRVLCQMSSKTPFPFKSTVKASVFKSGKETLIFLPDKLFLIQKNKIGALNYSDISSEVRTTRFVESESVPKDSIVVGSTWKYVNKSGGPDRRFSDNRQIPICEYGEIELTSNTGLNTLLMYSNPNYSPKTMF
ncbi:DUF4236 domain-containing protein [Treponema succinifaciens]|uniref:DUF4236 domain-containing protein n=1 Tax=Treponema succinifaciens (strain ATCC 33096 / DSM 2489 / 6091) TaxID=869209 RepID=F2NUW9_TRES6|nr:DUF4236 domain-containing protein [Treponema succinifaciens]AEB13073.1 hypothetical protein Tresu_0105 [Treponema succinifaciens DSM 2489]